MNIRTMIEADVPACLAIMNHTIALGGTTAKEEPFTAEGFKQYYFHDPKIINVAEVEGRIVGFQGVFEQEPGLYSIGSFTDQKNPMRGVGRALAAQMIKDCRADGGHTIIAKITADNTGGLAFYSKAGFEDWSIIHKAHQRSDGTWVDQIVKRIIL